MKKIKVKKGICLFALSVLIVVVSFSLLSCKNENENEISETRAPEVDKFSLLDGTTVPRYYYDYYLKTEGDEGKALTRSYELTAVMKWADEDGISINEQKKNSLVTGWILQIEDDFGTYYEESIQSKYGVSSSDLIQIYLDEVIYGMYLENISKEIIIDDDEIFNYYQENINDFHVITFIYGFLQKSNVSNDFALDFTNIKTREDMFLFVSKYSESDSKDEDVYIDVSKTSSLPIEVLSLLDNEMSVLDTFLVETEDKVFFLMCDYISDINSPDIVNEIRETLVEKKSDSYLQEKLDQYLAVNINKG